MYGGGVLVVLVVNMDMDELLVLVAVVVVLVVCNKDATRMWSRSVLDGEVPHVGHLVIWGEA